ncbi:MULTISPECIES: ABC transporter permease [unclassified Kitasatospora]|uniref:ABC transporter permease n=1 Tax=unclassified Kitasatospora TaxID=2633591 RepID=UPI0033E368D3
MFTKGYLISLLALSLITFGLVMGFDLVGRATSSTVAVCGAPAASFGAAPDKVRLQPCADQTEARALVQDKDVDAAVVVDGSHATVLVRADTGDHARAGVSALGENWVTFHALSLQKVDLDQLARDAAAAAPTTVTVGDAVSTLQLGAAVSLIVILFMQIIGQGAVVAQGVVEEKSTRVVEVLLATLTPLELLIGKVSGIATAAVVQVASMLGAVIAARSLMSEQAEALPGPQALATTVLWFLLTFAMFASLFAAAGSLVSRPEDLQGVMMPVMLLALAPVGVAAAAAAQLSAPWVTAVQYIPPFSGLVMPLKAAVGAVSPAEQVVAAGILLLVTAGCMALAARIYRNSILRIGAPVRWRQALVS